MSADFSDYECDPCPRCGAQAGKPCINPTTGAVANLPCIPRLTKGN